MNILKITIAIAMIGSSALAENYQPPKEPEPPTVTDNGVDLLPLLLIILGAAVVMSGKDDPQNPPVVTDQEYIFPIK